MFSSEQGLAGRTLQWQDWHLPQMLCYPDQLWCCLPIASRSLFLPDCTLRGGRHWSQLIWAPASTARTSAIPRQGISPTQIHGDRSSSDGISYSLFPDPMLTLPKIEVSLQSREQGEGLWDLALGIAHVQLRLLGRKTFPCVEKFPLAGFLHTFSLVAHVEAVKAEPHC